MPLLERLLRRTTLDENVTIAFDNLRANKLRSALTMLGVVIGVATVMTMASIVQGVREQILHTLEVAGPTTFYVMKVFSQQPLNPEALPKWVRIRPDLTGDEATAIAALPEIQYGAIWNQIIGRMDYQGERTQPTTVYGADDGFTLLMGGGLAAGRWFTPSEERKGAAVAVILESHARRLFGRLDPLGKTMLIAGKPVEVIGLYEPPANIFTPPGAETGAVVPYRFADHAYRIDKTNMLFIGVKPRDGISVAAAQEAVTVRLRELRRLRPGDGNTFDLITQDQILDVFNSITGVFFVVMIVLASVALMVGGIGVMAIMMVSVTDRTREIGVRKALGATRRDILMQFLVEAATLTGFGGVIGIVVGLVAGQGATRLLNIEASPPWGLTLIAVAVSVSIGLIFGVLPARRAARMDPIEALRYE
ncbi:MAG: ABC transporter permease [Gemmatimonadota bacterium]|nr:ABC transporter permease [Gemmatimonadota bacterium]